MPFLANKGKTMYYSVEDAKKCVGDGWGGLIESIYKKQSDLGVSMDVTQVKEKFGTLRFYCFTTSEMLDFIDTVEFISQFICEVCGKNGRTVEIRGWFKTLCKDCEKKDRKENATSI